MAPNLRSQSMLTKYLYDGHRGDDRNSSENVPFSDEVGDEIAGKAGDDHGAEGLQVSEQTQVEGSSASEETPPPSTVMVLSDGLVDGAFLNATPVGIGVPPRPRTALRSTPAVVDMRVPQPELSCDHVVAASKNPTADVTAATNSAGGSSSSATTNSTDSNVVILDPAVVSPAVRARKQAYKQNRHWQDSWVARLPWTESVVGADGRVTQVRCKICSEVKG
jgi:hypothetical protein